MSVLFQEGIAQVNLVARVMNQTGTEELADANVTLSNSSNTYTVVTDENGRFIISAEKGKYTISINYVGYVPYSEIITLDAPTTKEFLLTPETFKLQGATISISKVDATSPITNTTLSSKDLKTLDQSKDLPILLNFTPSTLVFSDAGNGIGYTGLRIRGIDPTRINVTLNDIPLNDAESQGVYWVNLPDIASSASSVQIQRGVGTSSNGSASFGGSLNIDNDNIAVEKFTEARLAYGSFNSQRISLLSGTGISSSGWGLQGRISYIKSDGFIDRASSDLKSAQISMGHFGKKSSLQANIMLGKERTYQAWWGIPQPKYYENDGELQRYVDQLWITGDDLNNLQQSNPQTYNYYTYENQVDDYGQNHFQLFYNTNLTTHAKLKTAVHYTRGKGFFEEFAAGDLLSNYNISPIINGSDTAYYADVIRRKWLDNHFYGGLANFAINKGKLRLDLGGSYNQYLGRHFGEATTEDFSDDENSKTVYYDEDATKNDGNVYIKYQYKSYTFTPYVDLQLRNIHYEFMGPTDLGEKAEQSVNYSFFNPKFGFTMRPTSRIKLSFLYAISNREPSRIDLASYTEAERRTAEKVNDLEIGLEMNSYRFGLSLNYYNMQYQDALVLNGEVNDVGLYTRINVDESFRKGLEIQARARLAKSVSLEGNITFSQNKILAFTEKVDNWDDFSVEEFKYENTNIAFSPNTIAAAILQIKLMPALKLELQAKYVSEQYLDNTQNNERKLEAFETIDAGLHYTKSNIFKMKELNLSLYFNNISNKQYAPNGYSFSGIINGNREHFNYLYPMAGMNAFLKLGIKI